MKKEAKIPVRKGTFRFAGGQLKKDREGVYYYSDMYFLRNAAILNPHLRTLSCAFCMTCFPSVDARKESGGYERVYRNAEAFLRENGFAEFAVNADYEKEPSADTLAVLAGHKVICEDGEDVSLVAVGFRGADYGDEWAANLVIGESGRAVGFDRGVDLAEGFLDGFLDSLGEKLCPRVKYWIAGYSRVAAIANLLGARIDKNAKKYRTWTGDIFTYTFESPAAAPKEDRRPYPSIHNTVNPHDLVPRVAPDSWGFRRYGSDDTVFPPIHSEEFREKIGEVQERLHGLNPEIEYDVDGFRTRMLQRARFGMAEEWEGKAVLFRPDEWWYHAKQDEFLDRFMDFMSKKIAHPEDGADPMDAERRKRFVTTYQAAFSELAGSYLGVGKQKKEIIRKEMVRFFREDLTKRRMAYIALRLFENRESSCRALELFFARLLQKRLLAEPALGLTKEELRRFFRGIERTAYYFLKCASYDMRRHRLGYLSTLIHNIRRITSSHMPEVTFAWLMTLDSYYHKDMSSYLLQEDGPAKETASAAEEAPAI